MATRLFFDNQTVVMTNDTLRVVNTPRVFLRWLVKKGELNLSLANIAVIYACTCDAFSRTSFEIEVIDEAGDSYYFHDRLTGFDEFIGKLSERFPGFNQLALEATRNELLPEVRNICWERSTGGQNGTNRP